MKLYSADKSGNKTAPKKFYSDGLLTKQVNSCDSPTPHLKYGWLETIKSHINPFTESEKFIYDTTQYLSFTSDLNRAFHFLATQKKFKHSPVKNRSEAEGFLFLLEIDSNRQTVIGKGIFLYSYKCNYYRCNSDLKFRSVLSGFIRCNICSEYSNYEHWLLLLDVETHLFERKKTFQEEYTLAQRDKEWLLMPLVPMQGVNSVGFQSRIHIADFWDVSLYKYEK